MKLVAATEVDAERESACAEADRSGEQVGAAVNESRGRLLGAACRRAVDDDVGACGQQWRAVAYPMPLVVPVIRVTGLWSSDMVRSKSDETVEPHVDSIWRTETPETA